MWAAIKLSNRSPALFLALAWIILTVSPAAAWTGFELDGLGSWATAAYLPSEASDGFTRWEVSGRFMAQETAGDLFLEVHALAGMTGWSNSSGRPVSSSTSMFRSLDLETSGTPRNNTIAFSEIDRLLITLNHQKFRLTLGRQAVTWGNAFYFNIEDLFGTFSLADISRLHKPGMDAALLTFSMGSFSEFTVVGVPRGNASGSGAGYLFLPAGGGTLTLVGGLIAGDIEAGGGYTLDVSGTKLFTQALYTYPEGENAFWQVTAGVENQLGTLTHFLGELHYNGWGSTDTGAYSAMRISDRFVDGRTLTVGRWNAALDLSLQLTPLFTGHSVAFVNLTDPSVLLRLYGLYSLSDVSQFIGGINYGLGNSPEGLTINSEYGGVPLTVNLELVVDF